MEKTNGKLGSPESCGRVRLPTECTQSLLMFSLYDQFDSSIFLCVFSNASPPPDSLRFFPHTCNACVKAHASATMHLCYSMLTNTSDDGDNYCSRRREAHYVSYRVHFPSLRLRPPLRTSPLPSPTRSATHSRNPAAGRISQPALLR
jgi:hypothetical protein